MSILENYNREDKFIRSLNNSFDKYVEINKERIEEILNKTDIIIVDENSSINTSWNEIYKTKDEKLKSKLLNRFSFELRNNHKQYKQILKRFIEEHLKHTKAITFVLKNQVKYIKDVIKRLEADYFSLAESEFDKFIFSFRDLSQELLEELIDELVVEYKDYLENSNLIEAPLLEIEDDGIDFNSVFSKVLLMNELGILNLIKENNPPIIDTDLAKVLSKITGTPYENIRRCISDIKTGRKNDPYKNEKNEVKVQNLLNKYRLNKKGE